MVSPLLAHRVDKSLYAGIIYAKSADNSATATNGNKYSYSSALLSILKTAVYGGVKSKSDKNHECRARGGLKWDACHERPSCFFLGNKKNLGLLNQ
jgi:hypothetical protein